MNRMKWLFLILIAFICGCCHSRHNRMVPTVRTTIIATANGISKERVYESRYPGKSVIVSERTYKVR